MRMNGRPIVFVIAALLGAGAGLAAQSKITLTHELLWSFQRVGAPMPSPDGKWVVFTVNEPSYEAARRRSPISGSWPPTAARHRGG